jgi:hypothetical protein
MPAGTCAWLAYAHVICKRYAEPINSCARVNQRSPIETRLLDWAKHVQYKIDDRSAIIAS